jgi:hypothetical protein
MRRILAGVACLALLIVAVSPFSSDARRARPRLAIATFDGPDIEVPPNSVTDVDAYVLKCPRRWQVTGFGVLNGANDVVFADPTSDGRGYAFAFGNPSTSTSFTASGNLRCAKGTKGLRVIRASAHGSERKAVRDWQAAHR